MNRSDIYLSSEYNYLAVFLTLGCPRTCSYCINELAGGTIERKTTPGDQWIAGLNRLRTDLPFTFHGGEPLIHPNFFDIMHGLREDIRVDLLSTFPFGADDFIRELEPWRFRRDLPYAAIRVTYHPEIMDLPTTIDCVSQLAAAEFDVAINIVDHPRLQARIEEILSLIGSRNLPVVVKPFLGQLNGTLHGQYKYLGACSMRSKQSVECKNSNLLIDPSGDVYRCHADLFQRIEQGILGNIFDDITDLRSRFTECDRFGFCSPCDVQVKFDRFGHWGYTAAQIRGGGDLIASAQAEVDWR